MNFQWYQDDDRCRSENDIYYCDNSSFKNLEADCPENYVITILGFGNVVNFDEGLTLSCENDPNDIVTTSIGKVWQRVRYTCCKIDEEAIIYKKKIVDSLNNYSITCLDDLVKYVYTDLPGVAINRKKFIVDNSLVKSERTLYILK